MENWRLNFYKLWGGQFFSGLTSMIVQYAFIWQITKETSSATYLSLASIVAFLPMIFFSPFIGGLIDRFSKKKILIGTDCFVAIVALVIALLSHFNGNVSIPIIFIAIFLRSIAQTFQQPTMQATTPLIVPEDEITRAGGQSGMMTYLIYLIAPAIAGGLFGNVPFPLIISLDIIGAILASTLTLLTTIPKMTVETPVEKQHFLEDTKIGFRELRKRIGVYHFVLVGALFTVIIMPMSSLYPLITTNYFHGNFAQAGIVEFVYSCGMIVAGILIGAFGKWKNRMPIIFLSTFVMGICFVICGLLPGNFTGYVWFAGLNMIAGFANPFFATLAMSLIQTKIPAEVLGRVLGIVNSLFSIAGPIGLIFGGPVADKIGVEKWFVIGGVGCVLVASLIYLIKTIWNADVVDTESEGTL